MLDQIKQSLHFQSEALDMRSKRQSLISSNISNVDTPGYKAVDVSFSKALGEATGVAAKKNKPGVADSPIPALKMTSGSDNTSVKRTHSGHLTGSPLDNSSFARAVKYRRGDTAALDGNSVNIEREKANFAENTVKYEASLRAISGRIKTLKSAIKDGI